MRNHTRLHRSFFFAFILPLFLFFPPGLLRGIQSLAPFFVSVVMPPPPPPPAAAAGVPPSLDAPRIKLLAVGDAGVGKSCLIKRYCEGRFVSKYIPTIGIDYGVKKTAVVTPAVATAGGGRSERPGMVRVNFWDVAGGPEYAEIRNEFYDAAQGILLLYDVRQLESFQHLPQWWGELTAYCEAMPKTSVDGSGGGGPAVAGRKRSSVTTTGNTAAGKAVGTTQGRAPVIYLCASKVDDVVEPSASSSSVASPRGRRVVTEEQGRAWAAEHGCAGYFEVSATSDQAVKDVIDSLVAKVVNTFM